VGGALVLEEPYARFLALALIMLALGIGLSLLSMRPTLREFHRRDEVVLRLGEGIVISPPETPDLLVVKLSRLSLSPNTTVSLNITIGGDSRVLAITGGEKAVLDLNTNLTVVFVELIGLSGPGAATISYDYHVIGYTYPLAWVSLPAAILATAGVGLLFIGIAEKVFLSKEEIASSVEAEEAPGSGNL